MTAFANLKRCLDLTEQHIGRALESRDATRKLLEHLAKIAGPNAGAPKVLLMLARLATSAVDWLEGDLRIEILGDGEVSVFDVLSDLGGGTFERVLPSIAMNVPVEEFQRAVERVPHMIEPLRVRARKGKRLVLSATEHVRRSSIPPARVQISDKSIFVASASPGSVFPPNLTKPKIVLKPIGVPRLPLTASAARTGKSRPPASSRGGKSTPPASARDGKSTPPATSGRKTKRPSGAVPPPDVDSGWDDD